MIDFSSVRFVSFRPSMYPNEMKIKDELSLGLFVFGQTSGIHEKREIERKKYARVCDKWKKHSVHINNNSQKEEAVRKKEWVSQRDSQD